MRLERTGHYSRSPGPPGAPTSPASPVSEKLAQEDTGFQLEPASEQRAEQPDRELRQPLSGEGRSPRRQGRAALAGQGTKGASECTGPHRVLGRADVPVRRGRGSRPGSFIFLFNPFLFKQLLCRSWGSLLQPSACPASSLHSLPGRLPHCRAQKARVETSEQIFGK